tara:strand:+ start:754 stop:1017 length:264 start_codon:yes stop_codon:yes gene_type:complete
MSELDYIKKTLAEGLVMIGNIENPTTSEHKTMIYVDTANAKLHKTGEMIHALTPALGDMIQFVQEYVPEQYHNVMNHAWSGIGDWQA